MARGLDHIVHAVRDLDAAVELYRGLGFQVGARNRHPPSWGTQNHIIQLPGTFIELLAVANASGIVPHSSRHFSFGAFNRDFLVHEQGLSMLVLEGHGAADADEFRAEGIGDFELYEFEREGKRPDGMVVKVAFALAFASDPRAPDIGFFTSLQHYPENFWNPAFQVHANTATSVAGVVLVAQDPGKPCKLSDRLRRRGRPSVRKRADDQNPSWEHRGCNTGHLRRTLWSVSAGRFAWRKAGSVALFGDRRKLAGRHPR